MATTQRQTVVGVFDDARDAQRAIEELRRAGFRDDQIGVASHDRKTTATGDADDKGSHAGTGAVTGVLAGAGVGAAWGIGIAAGLIPAIGPVIAGGTLAAILASAGLGAAAAGIAGALIGAGIPEDEAHYYENEFKAGRTIVTVKAENRATEATAILNRHNGHDMRTRQSAASAPVAGVSHAATATTGSTHAASAQKLSGTQYDTGVAHTSATHTGSTQSASATGAAAGQKVQVREEEMHVRKQPVETGEVRVRKEVHTETKTLEVPVRKEEVVIERHPVAGRTAAAGDIREGQEIRIPVTEEQVRVEKVPVVKEEVTVGKRQVTETEHVAETVRKEEVKVEKTGEVDVRDAKTRKTK